jgi:chemotaxis protein MotA
MLIILGYLILSDHHAIEFLTDYLRLMVGGNLNAFELVVVAVHRGAGKTAVAVILAMAEMGREVLDFDESRGAAHTVPEIG